MNESNFYSAEYVNSILQENKSLEQVNVSLLNKLQTLEDKMETHNQSQDAMDRQIKTKDESLNKAEQIIRKMQAEIENAKRNIDVNERQIKTLKEQYKNLQISYDKQQRHLQDSELKRDVANDSKLEVKQIMAKMEKMRRDHLFEFDVEKEKYQNLLHRSTDLERDFQTLQLSLEAKEQECFTLESHNTIQSQQINSLQNEISNMIDKLEDIKNSYESELESKDEQLQKNRNIALTQLRQMQQQMRQDSVNNQKELMKLQEELQIKIQKRDKKRDENKILSQSDKKKSLKDPLITKRSSSNMRGSSGLTTKLGKSTARSYSQTNIMTELLQPIKSQVEQDMFVNSPLISWLKQQLQDAWLREKQLKDFVNQYSERCLVKLQIRLEDLEKQRGRVRAEVEMWQMRNEEMETRLYNTNKKMWSIKQIAVEQQKQLKRQTVERQAIIMELEAYRNITQENILLCKNHYYDIYDQLRNAEGYQQIFHNLSVTKDNIDEADHDRAKLVKQLNTQIEVSARQRRTIQDQDEKIRIMEMEGKTMSEHFDQQSDKTLCKIQNIFDIIDPETSRVLVEPTIDQLINLIQGKIGNFNYFQKQEIATSPLRSRSASPKRELRALDNKERENFEAIIRDQQDKIFALENDNAYLSGQVNAPLRGISSVQSMNPIIQPELEAKLKNDAEMMAIENRQLRCDISEKQIIIEELSQKNHRLQKDNKEARDKLFQTQSFFGDTRDNRNNLQNIGSTLQEMDSSFLNNQYANALRNPQNVINSMSMSRNPPVPQEYPILFSNQSQNIKIDPDLEATQPPPQTSKFGAAGNINAMSQNMDYGGKHNQTVLDHQQSQDALSNYIAQTASGPLTLAPHNVTLDTHQIQEAHKRHRDQMVVIQSIKEDIIDAVNDLKAKKDIWNITQMHEEKCDVLIKKMVLNAREADHIAHSYDLVRGLFDILREVQKSKINQSDKKQEIIEDLQEVKSENETKVLKNIEIVIDVFKKAAEKIGKIGERDWREVLEQQSYVLEELVSIQENLQKVGANHKGYKQAQVNFGHALSDFQFCLSKALDNLVSRDVDQDQRQMGTTSLRIKTKRIDETELKRQISEVLALSQKKLHSDASLQIAHHMGLKGSQRLNSLLEVKQLSNKIMKALREDLACSHSIYIKRMNADIIEYESNQRQTNEDMRRMPVEELIKIIQLLKQDILSLRLNEIFMKKCSDQIKALKSAISICNFESFFQAYQTQSQYEFPQKLLKILSDLADSITKEARGAFAIDMKQTSMIRTEFTEEILSIFNLQTQSIKDANNLSEILKLAY